jgi:hypothetical protein
MAREREDRNRRRRARFVERDAEGKFREVDADGRDWEEELSASPNEEIKADDFDDGIEPKTAGS